MGIFTGLSGRADYTRRPWIGPRAGSQTGGPYTSRMKMDPRSRRRDCALGSLLLAVALTSACGGDKGAGETAATQSASDVAPAAPAPAPAAASDDAPDTSDMGPLVLAKINANPSIEGKATLVEFRQKSVSIQPLGDRMKSAVVEFEGVVTFSSDVSWSWQGPTKAGAPQNFEARAEYVDQGKGWQLVEPLGIYPL